jgi:hypothetical protein
VRLLTHGTDAAAGGFQEPGGVEVAEVEDDVLILASTVVVDMCCHADRK